MAVLVIAEHDNAALKAATLNTVTAAAKLGGDIHVLVAGSGCAGAAQAAAQLAGVAVVKVADAAHYADQTAENLAALIVAHKAGYTHILAASTSHGKNTLPRVAALLDGAVFVAHNAPFDLRFLDAELMAAGYHPLGNMCVDTLELATDDDLPSALTRFMDMRQRRVRTGAAA